MAKESQQRNGKSSPFPRIHPNRHRIGVFRRNYPRLHGLFVRETQIACIVIDRRLFAQIPPIHTAVYELIASCGDMLAHVRQVHRSHRFLPEDANMLGLFLYPHCGTLLRNKR